MEHICVDKIEVAKRQIIEAVMLFFESRDPIVIHTVIASAHQILVDIGKTQGICSATKNPDGLTIDELKKHVKMVNMPYFF